MERWWWRQRHGVKFTLVLSSPLYVCFASLLVIYHQMKPKWFRNQTGDCSHTLLSSGFFIDKMSDYGTGFLMAGVALIVSAMFLLLLHQMNRRGQSLRYCTCDGGNACRRDSAKGQSWIKRGSGKLIYCGWSRSFQSSGSQRQQFIHGRDWRSIFFSKLLLCFSIGNYFSIERTSYSVMMLGGDFFHN